MAFPQGVRLRPERPRRGVQLPLHRRQRRHRLPLGLGDLGLHEVEGAGELLRGGVTLILAIPRRLFISEKFNRHGVLR